MNNNNNKRNKLKLNKYKREAIETLIDKKSLFETIRRFINRDKEIKYYINNNNLQNNTPKHIRMELINKWINKYGILNFMSKGELKELYFKQDSINRFNLHEDLNEEKISKFNTKNYIYLNNLRNEYLYDSRMLYGSQLYKSLNNYKEKGDFFINTIIPLLPSIVLTSSQTYTSLSKIIVLNPLLIICYDNGLINIYKNNQLIYSYNLHNAEIKDCEVSDCRQYICSTDKNGRILLVKIGCNINTKIHYCRFKEYYTPKDKIKNNKGKINIKIPYILFKLNSLVEAIVWSGCNLILVDIHGVIIKYKIEEICKFKEIQMNEEEEIITAPITLYPISKYDITKKLIINPLISVISISNCHRYLFIGGNWSGILIYDMLEIYKTNQIDNLIFKSNNIIINNKKYKLIEPNFNEILEKKEIENNLNKYMFISCDRVVDMMYHPLKDSLVIATTGEVFELSFQEISGSKKLTNLNIKPFILRNLKLNPDNLHSAINKTIKITEKSITMEIKGNNFPKNMLKNKLFNGCWERRDIIGYNFHENFIQFDNYEIPEELPFILRTLICHDHILLLLTNNKLMVEHKWCQCLNIKKDFNRGMYVPIEVGSACLIEVHPKKRLIFIADYDVKCYDLYGKQIFNLDFELIYKFDKSINKKLNNNLNKLENKNLIYRKGNEHKIIEIIFNEGGDELYIADEMGFVNIYSLTFNEQNNIKTTIKKIKKKNKIKEIYEIKNKNKNNNEFRGLNKINKKNKLIIDQNYTFYEPLNINLNFMEYICGYIEIGNAYENYINEFNKNINYEFSVPIKENDKKTNLFKNNDLNSFDNFINESIKNCNDCIYNYSNNNNYGDKIPLKFNGDFIFNIKNQSYDHSIKDHLINKNERDSYKILHYLKYNEEDLISVHKYWFNFYEAMDHPTVLDIEISEDSFTEISDTLIKHISDSNSSITGENKNIISDLSSFEGTSLSEDEDSLEDFIDDNEETEED